MEINEKIIEFNNYLTKTNNLEVNSSLLMMEDYTLKRLSDDRLIDKRNRIIKKIESLKEKDIVIPENDEFLFYLFFPSIRWNTLGVISENNDLVKPVSGGFYLNSIYSILTSDNFPFWTKTDRYLEFEPRSNEDAQLLSDLAWFDSPTRLKESGEYTPFFTCVNVKRNVFSDKLYFFDSHFVYQLPFNNYEEYVKAMMRAASVECWQFFYIEPEELINRNLGKSYFTIFLSSYRIEGHSKLHFNPEIKADRLDVIHEYLEQCVTTLPLIFPEMDFTYHKDYFEKFNALYLEARKK